MMGEGGGVLMRKGVRSIGAEIQCESCIYMPAEGRRQAGGGGQRSTPLEGVVVVVEPAGAIKDEGGEGSPAWKARVSGWRAGSCLATTPFGARAWIRPVCPGRVA